MYADFTRSLMPATLRQAMVDQSRRALSFQKQVFDWQLSQAQTMEKQVVSMMDLAMDNSRKAFEAVQKAQDDALAAWTPAEQGQA